MAKRLRGYGDGYKPYAGRRKYPWLKALLVLLLLGAMAFAALEVYIGLHSGTRLVGQPRIMVIFGCQVRSDGPAQTLQDRLDTALDYLKDHPDMTVVVTGGQGEDEPMTEAACMATYLTDHGFEGEVLQEDRSRNTWTNVNYTLDLLEQEGYSLTEDVLLVSNGFHLARIEMLWDRARVARLPGETYNDQYISTLAAPVTYRPAVIRNFLREPAALVKSFLFDR